MSTMARTLVAGVDSSTQATKIVVCDAATGEVIRTGRAPHPDGSEIDPERWWDAYLAASGEGLLDGVSALGVAGQQHGIVALDMDAEVVRPALLWNDTRSAEAGRDLVAELGGQAAWARAVGSVPVASFTVTKLRWLAEHEPRSAARVAEVVLPHDWITGRILHGRAVTTGNHCTDRGDASGTGYWSPATGEYRTDLIDLAFGRVVGTPAVRGPNEPAGVTKDGMLLSAGTGDNMGAGLGLGLEPGDVAVSLGTSGTVFGLHATATQDSTGMVAGFADATGLFLPLVCTLNAARVLGAVSSMLDTDLTGLDRLALQAAPGSGGLTLLPYLDGERTPDLPHASGTLGGLTRDNATPANLARAAVEGMLCGLGDGPTRCGAQGVQVRRVLLIGGAARSRAVRAIAPDLFGVAVTVPVPGEYVARGAARQAAWTLMTSAGRPQLPPWRVAAATVCEPSAADAENVRTAYRHLREKVHPSTRPVGCAG